MPYFSMHDVYDDDEPDSKLVIAIKDDNNTLARKILTSTKAPSKVKVLNEAKKWSEVEEKYGYDKSWEWFGDTPLIAAARRGNFEISKLLLLEGADPTLKGSPSDDVVETALEAAKSAKKIIDDKIDRLKRSECNSYDFNGRSLMTDNQRLNVAEKLAGDLLRYTGVVNLLNEVDKFWTKAKYAGPTFTMDRNKAFKKNYNKPKDMKALSDAINSITEDCNIDETAVVIASYAALLKTLHDKRQQ